MVCALAVACALSACKGRPRAAAGEDDCRWRPEGDPAVSVADLDRAIACGAAALARHQDGRGAIVAPTYAAFREGHATTALAALALGQAPGLKATFAYARASAFVATSVRDGRFVAPPPPYPLYAAALGALVLSTPGNERYRAERDVLLTEVRRRQLGPENGWRPDDVSYGGWGYAVLPPVRPTEPDYDPARDEERAANLSATLLAIGALTLAGAPPDDPALVAAARFVDRCQNRMQPCPPVGACVTDGGFMFTPVPALRDSNKAGDVDGRPRSYGTMTADGLRALVRLGVPLHDPRVGEARAWLIVWFDPELPPGPFPREAESRRRAGTYYWAWTAAHALQRLGNRGLPTARGEVDWPMALARSLLARQAADGSWSNPSTELREDDPVVATSFAMAALTIARQMLARDYRSHAGWR